MTRLAVLAFLVISACAGGQRGAPEAPLDEAVRARLAEIARVGRALHEQDQACARASDAFLKRAQAADREAVRGWIARRDGIAYLVSFLGGSAEAPVLVGDVHVLGEATAVTLRPSRALSAEERSMWAARQRASPSGRTECGAINIVLLPVSGGGWDVFLLAATTARAVVWGGHRRVRVTADGQGIVETEDFSRSCLWMPFDESATALHVTHVVSDVPAPTHVFVSLTFRRPVVVGAGGHVWAVEGDAIRRLER